MIEFFFDCSIPWTYLAFRNLQLLAAELEEPISWRPVRWAAFSTASTKAFTWCAKT